MNHAPVNYIYPRRGNRYFDPEFQQGGDAMYGHFLGVVLLVYYHHCQPLVCCRYDPGLVLL